MNTSVGKQWMLGAALLLASTPTAFAVSDGNYDPAKQHCTGSADNANAPQNIELHCHSLTFTVRDGDAVTYHEYFGVGVQQQPDTGGNPIIDLNPAPLSLGKHQTVDVWFDIGQRLPNDTDNSGDTCYLVSVDFDISDFDQCNVTPFDWVTKNLVNSAPPSCSANPNGAKPPTVTGPTHCNFVAGGSTAPPANPPSSLHLYFGADDNLDAGEHDSAKSVSNGPSDGGAVVVNLDPASLMTWMGNVMSATSGSRGQLLTHPLPLFDAGLGLCADGFCMSTQTTRRDRAYSGGTPNHQPVADYSHHTFDPYNCSNNDAECQAQPGDKGRTPEDWNNLNGDPSIEPGVQIYEDPDAQGSPAGPVYPIPVIYVGTCGVIIGGGVLCNDGGDLNKGNCSTSTPLGFPAGTPFTNSVGQIVIPTGCDTSS